MAFPPGFKPGASRTTLHCPLATRVSLPGQRNYGRYNLALCTIYLSLDSRVGQISPVTPIYLLRLLYGCIIPLKLTIQEHVRVYSDNLKFIIQRHDDKILQLHSCVRLQSLRFQRYLPADLCTKKSSIFFSPSLFGLYQLLNQLIML